MRSTIRHEDLRKGLLAARNKVKDKKIIFEKLGRAKIFVGFIDTIGEAVSDVRPRIESLPVCILTQASKIHPAVKATFLGLGLLIDVRSISTSLLAPNEYADVENRLANDKSNVGMPLSTFWISWTASSTSGYGFPTSTRDQGRRNRFIGYWN